MARLPCLGAAAPKGRRMRTEPGERPPLATLTRLLAERVGFEPTDHLAVVNALAGRPIRPLWHLSEAGAVYGKPSAKGTVDQSGSITSLACGTVAERTIAAALKAADPQGSGGSNPSRSAGGFVDVHRRPRRSTEMCSELVRCPHGRLHVHRRFCSVTPAPWADRFERREVDVPQARHRRSADPLGGRRHLVVLPRLARQRSARPRLGRPRSRGRNRPHPAGRDAFSGLGRHVRADEDQRRAGATSPAHTKAETNEATLSDASHARPSAIAAVQAVPIAWI